MSNGLSKPLNNQFERIIKDYTGIEKVTILKSQFVNGPAGAEHALDVALDGDRAGFCIIDGKVTNEFDPDEDKVGELKYGPTWI
jgi:hypothetical protein